jgi:phytanoyl-CoA hydroxylase
LELPSDLWLDQPDAHERINEELAAGRISAEEAERLRMFTDVGYLTFSIDIDADFSEAFDDDVARLWQERPADLAVSPPGSGGPTSFRDFEGPARQRGYRIPDLHSHSDRALDLYVGAEIFRMVELVYGRHAIAFQSLYFEHGSEQALHRDPMFVVTEPASHLLASWVALEDVTAGSGPLAYVPGSHRLPWFEFEPGSVRRPHGVPIETRRNFGIALQEAMQERGLSAQQFTCRRGDVFIWHGGLVHGGSSITDERQTRKSFVTHYCTEENYTSRRSNVRFRNGDGWRLVESTTERVIERDRGRGLDNPLRQVEAPQRGWRDRVTRRRRAG